MKNFLLPSLVVVLSLFVLAFAGCSNEEKMAEIARLTQENAALENNIQSLQLSLDSLKAYADSVNAVYEKLDLKSN